MNKPSNSSAKILVSVDEEYVATVELNNGDYNFFDMEMLMSLAQTFESLDEDARCRAILLCSTGKAFCAGHDLKEMRANPQKAYYDALFARSLAGLHRCR